MAKRGRPTLYPEDYYESMKTANLFVGYAPQKTKRTIQNFSYAAKASTAIKDMSDDDVCCFFIDESNNKVKWSVLTELGRYKHPEIIRDIAKQIYELAQKEGDMPVKEWVKIIRQHRIEYQSKVKSDT